MTMPATSQGHGDRPNGPATAQGRSRLARWLLLVFGATVLVVAVVVAVAEPEAEIDPRSDTTEAQDGGGDFTLKADPFLTDDDLARIRDGLERVHRVDAAPRRLSECIDVPTGVDAERRVAAFAAFAGSRASDWLNNVVLRYADAAAAHALVAELWRQFSVCPSGPDQEVEKIGWRFNQSDPSTAEPFFDSHADEGFVRARWFEVGPGQLPPNKYELAVARHGNVVVVIDSTVSGDRGHVMLVKALGRALGTQGNRCGAPDPWHKEENYAPALWAELQWERSCV